MTVGSEMCWDVSLRACACTSTSVQADSNSCFLVLLWFLQGRKEPAGLRTVQTAAGRLPLGRAGAHPGAHPGLRQEGREAVQVAG